MAKLQDRFLPWRWPKYVTSSLLISLGGMLFGLDTGIIGPVTTMNSFTTSFGQLSPTVHGLVVSTILIPAATASSFAGPLSNKIGRTYGVMVGAIVFTLGTALEASAVSLGMFLVGRVLTGIGEGLFLSTITVYVCEVAPTETRGPLASFQQMMTTVGLCSGYFISYGTTKITSSFSWRIPFIVQSLLSAVLALSCPFLPQSPRWLISVGRIGEVPAKIQELGLSPAAFAEETSQILNEKTQHTQLSRKRRFLAVFSKNSRKQTSFAIFLMAMAQFSGIDGVLYYAPILFQQAGLSSREASFLASGVSALLIVLVTIPACIYADQFSRRSTSIIGGYLLSGCMFLIGLLYASKSVHGSHGVARWVVIVAIYLFAIVYSVTWAVVIRIYSSEIQPTATRAAASSLAQGSNWIANFIVAFTTPIFLSRSTFGAYFLFAACSLLTAVVCTLLMPETRGRAIDTIDDPFAGVISSTHILKPLTVRSRRLIARRNQIDGHTEGSVAANRQSQNSDSSIVETSLARPVQIS